MVPSGPSVTRGKTLVMHDKDKSVQNQTVHMDGPIKLRHANRGIKKVGKVNRFVMSIQEKMLKSRALNMQMNNSGVNRSIKNRGGIEEVVRNAADEYHSQHFLRQQANSRRTDQTGRSSHSPARGTSRRSTSRERS